MEMKGKDSVRSLNLDESFEKNAEKFTSLKHDRKMLKKSDNYWCFKALFANAQRQKQGIEYKKLDRYTNAPWNKKGEPMVNVGSRISDLVNLYGIPVKVEYVEKIAKYSL